MIRRLARSVGVLVASTGLSWAGIAGFADPAFAACTVNIGVCSATCTSTVNLGGCDSGTCTVNTGTCGGGTCQINLGYCGSGCSSTVNVGDCGQTAAGTNSCIGTGSASLGTGIVTWPTVSTNVSFTFTFNCATGGTITGSGLLSAASCGRSTGVGSIPGLGDISIETYFSYIVVTGAATGGGNTIPIPDLSTIPPGNSCANGTAQTFQLTGGLVW